MLFQTNSGLININHIVSVDPCPSPIGEVRSAIHFTDGSSRSVPLPLSHFEQAAGVIVPAQLGFLLVEAVMPFPGDEEHGIFYRESPIIAFRIASGDKAPVPITVEGEPTGGRDHPYTVQQPNGPCAGPTGWYDDLEAFRAQCEHGLASRRVA